MPLARLPLDDLRLVLAGAGRVGSSLARWLAASGARAEAIAGRPGSESARALAAELGSRPVELATLSSAPADLLLLAVPDAALAEVARDLATRAQAAVVLHVAGALGASVLAPLRDGGSAVGTWHPLKAFPRPSREPADAAGTFFALDGDPPARDLGRRLAAALGATAAPVDENERSLYHFAATLAAGGVTTLVAVAAHLADRLSLPEAARAGYVELARGALEAARVADHPADSITGPVARGDTETVLRQLDELDRVEPRLRPLALEIARATLLEMALRGAATPAQKALAERLERLELLDRPKDRVLTSLPKH